jgi:hypothetical protein
MRWLYGVDYSTYTVDDKLCVYVHDWFSIGGVNDNADPWLVVPITYLTYICNTHY